MNIFKNKFFVLLMACVIVFASTLLSVNIKLGREFGKITDGFYSGVLVDGKREASIHSQLMIISRSAEDLAAVAEKNGLDVFDFKNEISFFDYVILDEQDNISYIHYTYETLLEYIANVSYLIGDIPLNESDESIVTASLQAIADAKECIEASAYNESVRKYISSLDFPMEFFAELAGVDLPEYFA